MFKLSSNTQYAIQALVQIGENANTPYASAAALSKRAKLSRRFLGRQLKSLTQHGILASSLGRKGGFRLARSPRRITLLAIIEAVEGPMALVDSADDPLIALLGAGAAKRFEGVGAAITRDACRRLTALTLADLRDSR